MTRAAGVRGLLALALVLTLAVGLLAAGVLFTSGGGSGGGSEPLAGTRAEQAGRSGDVDAVQTAGADTLTDVVAGLQRRLARVPRDDSSWAALGTAYVGQAAVTGDPTYYPRAQRALARSMRIRPQGNAAALTGMASLAAARHDFVAARDQADAARRINPYNAASQGVLSDALTQLGRYRASFDALQRMLDLKPGVPSFTRASYAWELRGETASAQDALQRALALASRPSDVAFCRYYLGELAWHAGNLPVADRQYAAGLVADPSYTPLLAGRAKVAAARGRTELAVSRYDDVLRRLPLPEHLIAYADLLTSLGRDRAARRQLALVQTTTALFRAEGALPDPQLVLFAADHGRPEAALSSAREVWRAQKGVEVADAYAWALHVNGRDADALRLAQAAARLGTRSALFAYHRGMIERALGDDRAARRSLQRALHLNPHFSTVHAPRAAAALESLRS